MKRIFVKNVVFLVTPLLLLGGCNQQRFAELNPASSESKNGPIEEVPPTCKPIKELGVWLDENDDGDTTAERFLGTFLVFSGETTHVENYNYFSWSAHPVIGPQPQGYASQVFAYEGTDGLGLVFFHNVDKTDPNYNGSAYNHVQWEITTTGNQVLDSVYLTDDIRPINQAPPSGPNTPTGFNELFLDPAQSNGAQNIYLGDWEYWDNTDGGTIGPFSGTDFSIRVRIDQTGNVTNAMFHSFDGTYFPLKDGQNQISSFIVGFVQMVCL